MNKVKKNKSPLTKAFETSVVRQQSAVENGNRLASRRADLSRTWTGVLQIELQPSEECRGVVIPIKTDMHFEEAPKGVEAWISR